VGRRHRRTGRLIDEGFLLEILHDGQTIVATGVHDNYCHHD
jgi:hypothetical protein